MFLFLYPRLRVLSAIFQLEAGTAKKHNTFSTPVFVLLLIKTSILEFKFTQYFSTLFLTLNYNKNHNCGLKGILLIGNDSLWSEAPSPAVTGKSNDCSSLLNGKYGRIMIG